jgi:hypothetical protein
MILRMINAVKALTTGVAFEGILLFSWSGIARAGTLALDVASTNSFAGTADAGTWGWEFTAPLLRLRI